MSFAGGSSHTRRLNRSSLTPLRYQLEEALLDRIDSGEWQPSDLLPTESELCEIYDVSRTIVRQALDSLERAGLIRRARGVGTFVCERKITVRLLQDPDGFYAHMVAQGLTVRTQVMGKELVPAPDWVARCLEIPPTTQVLRLDRLRSVEAERVFLATTYTALGPCDEIISEDFASRSLFEVLKQYCGVVPESGVRVIEAVLARPLEAELLQVPIGSPLFKLHVETRAQGGQPMACSELWLRGDRAVLQADLSPSAASPSAFEPASVDPRLGPSIVADLADGDQAKAPDVVSP
jgi:GntR family transcriptional regulator